MRLVTVGTGTVVPDPSRGSACHWVEDRATRLLVDCGAGAIPGLARADLPWGSIDHLLISHFHADHIAEIPSLIFAMKYGMAPARQAPLEIWGPEGTVQLFSSFAAAFGGWVLDPGFPVAIREIQPGAGLQLGDIDVTAAETPHTAESLAFRFEGPDRTLGYTGDTGPSDALAKFFRGIDLLLAECSLPDALAGEVHLGPESLARLATGAGVRRLVVTHVYPQLRRADLPGLLVAAGYEGQIFMAADGVEFVV